MILNNFPIGKDNVFFKRPTEYSKFVTFVFLKNNAAFW